MNAVISTPTLQEELQMRGASRMTEGQAMLDLARSLGRFEDATGQRLAVVDAGLVRFAEPVAQDWASADAGLADVDLEVVLHIDPELSGVDEPVAPAADNPAPPVAPAPAPVPAPDPAPEPDQEPEAVARAMAAHDAGRSSDIMAFLMEQIVTHRQVREQGFPTWDLDIDGVAYVLQYAAIGPAYSLYRERISDAEELS